MDAAEDKTEERIMPRVIEDEMQQSFLGYAMSVIISRALPDVKDGLKPVHRRILYAMNEMGMLHNKPFKKSARIVGEVLGKYHPHGDTAVYDAMVRMAQEFSLRYPLVQGQGNFGSVDGDSAAAMRYTEARLNKLSEEMLQDLDKETVLFVPNFDGSLTEPAVLPAKAPNLLINGSSGIAVGMATNIPPHNLPEVCDGAIKVIDRPDIKPEELITTIKGPDFPTGGIIQGSAGIKEAYKTGRGKIRVKAKIQVEEAKKKTRLIITEIPYQVNKSQLIEEIARLVRDKKIQGISDLRDESDREGMRIVIELRQGANTDIVQNQLLKHTRLQTTFGIIMIALVDNEPITLNLKQLLEEFIKHRKTVVRKRTEYELKQATEKAHILEGLIIALDNIDPVIKLIKEAKSAKEAKQGLIDDYKLSEKQSQAILDMKLQRLTGLEQEKIRQDHKKLLQLIKELKEILESEQKIRDIIKKELTQLKEEYGDERRTKIIAEEAQKFEEEELIKPEETVVTLTHAGYIKRQPLDSYKKQKRGGRGVIGMETKETDFVEEIFSANTHDYLLCFTNKGKIHWIKVYQIPEAGRYAKGTAIVNMLEMGKSENITACIPIRDFKKENYLFFVTKKGTVKKTSLEEFSKPRKGGIIALGLTPDDELISVDWTGGNKKIIIATQQGMAVHFDEKEVRPMGRTARGVIGIKLKKNDNVIGAVVAQENKTLLTATEKGYGKRTPIKEYRLTSRGGVGVINIKVTDKNGKAVTIKSVNEDDEIILISQHGIVIRTAAKGVSITGRATQGVRVMKLEDKDKLVAAAKIAKEEEIE
ncbi:DNA gyrase subunit A [Candidatus Woesearchaeota archaeon]|nr:DNA gyrase subunit A [Candidatus Woesearchaeota archaeon]